MDDLIRMEVTGMAELYAALTQLPINVGTNVLRGAVYAGAKVIKDAVVERAPVYTGDDPRVIAGTLKDAVYMKQIPELSSEIQQVFYIGVRKGKKEQAKGRDAYYWSWVEFGHHMIPRKPKGITMKAHRLATLSLGPANFVAPHPFVRPGFDASKNNALEAIKAYMAKRIPQEAEKLSRK